VGQLQVLNRVPQRLAHKDKPPKRRRSRGPATVSVQEECTAGPLLTEVLRIKSLGEITKKKMCLPIFCAGTLVYAPRENISELRVAYDQHTEPK
jgi:hypothetical protein